VRQDRVVITTRLDAEKAFEEGMGAWDVQRNPSGAGLVLHDAVLVEDDGPGANGAIGLTRDAPPTVVIGDAVRIKKILHVEDARAAHAWLTIRSLQRHGGGLCVELNGTPLPGGMEAGLLAIPVPLLRKGDNEVVLHAQGGGRATMAFSPRADILRNAPERKSRPGRSYRSGDHGATWESVDGEFNVRLHLQQYRHEGTVLSPVVDAGKPPDEPGVLSRRVVIRRLELAWEGVTPGDSRVELAFRSGASPVVDAASWSEWRTSPHPVPAGHRFVQWRATLATRNPLLTPVLHAVTMTAEIAAPEPQAWTKTVRVLGHHNEEIRYTSIPFAYEDSRHPRLQALRRKYRLDEVVRNADPELEKLAALRDWVAKQWKWAPPKDTYPAWDADEILEGRTGFCVQFAVVYMQCALSLGFPARFVFGIHPQVTGGHEVCEVWSNQFRKWVFMDPADNFHHVDPATMTPLDMLEVHERILANCYGDQVAGPETRPQEVPEALDIGTCYRLDREPSPPPAEDPKIERRRPWAYWLLMRMMPRNNFYGQADPVPKCQGFSWEWTGYWAWEDRQTPRDWQRHFGNLSGRRSDWQWTLNQVRFAAEFGDAPKTIVIRMGTATPGFDSFLIRIDRGAWVRCGAEWPWQLHPGANRVEMRVANHAGVLGPPSFLEVTLGS